jgi:hypothetical protein
MECHARKEKGKKSGVIKATTVKFSFSIKNFVFSRTPSFAPQGHTLSKFD